MRGRVMLLYLAMALWTMRAILPQFGSAFLVAADAPVTHVGLADQASMVFATARNARTWVTHPLRLLDFEQCYPTPRAAGLGSALFADGLVGVPAYLVGLEPIAIQNFVALAMFWLCAAGMCALAWHFTGDPGGAFMAGLLFAFHPFRVNVGTQWPGIVGNQWTPFALLFAHRLFVQSRWRDAAGLAIFVGLATLGSLYQLLPLFVTGGAVGVALLLRHWRRLPALAPKLLAVGIAVGLAATVAFSAHLYMRDVWGTSQGRGSMLPNITVFLPGGAAFPGWMLLGLALLGLLDRARGRRGDDPRLLCVPLTVLGVWLVVSALPLPGGHVVPSLSVYLGQVLPGLDSARGVSFGVLGVYVPLALLAAFGVQALTEHRSASARRTLGVLLGVAGCIEVAWPPAARASFGLSPTRQIVPLAPAQELLDAYRRSVDGAVLDLPLVPDFGWLRNAHYVTLGAYHHHPLNACQFSYPSPLEGEIRALANRLPEPAAADALVALGFRTVALHFEYGFPGDRDRQHGQMEALAQSGRAEMIATVRDHEIYRLRSPVAVTHDLGALRGVPQALQTVTAPRAALTFGLQNTGAALWRVADPLEPQPVTFRWHDETGKVRGNFAQRVRLPLTIGAGETATISPTVLVVVPSGRYRVTLALANDPEHPLAEAMASYQ